MFTLAQLASFVAVAEERHFGRAAARLHLTQPPLSRQIRLLEQEVGVTLLDRAGRTVKVTPAGRVFLAEARRILRLAEESSLAVRRIPTGAGGTLTVGFTAVSVHGYVQSFLRRIAEELPHVDLVLREMVTADQVEAIAVGDIDLGFVRPPVTRAGLASRVVHAERLLLAAPLRDPFTEPGWPGDIGQLDGRDLVMYSPVESRYFYELVLGMTVRAHARPRYVQYVSQVHTMLALVQAGVGLAIVPESATALHPDGVAFVGLADAQSPAVELAATWHETADSPVLTRALSLLTAPANEGLQPGELVVYIGRPDGDDRTCAGTFLLVPGLGESASPMTASPMTVRTSLDDRRAAGVAAREQAPRSAHSGWEPATDRPSPVKVLAEESAGREPDLVPVRHGRMLASPFTFYRGAAGIMAEDLKATPRSGLDVQLCGDAHLLNFGVFGSPERRLVFDLNDFDETLPGPFEYDVKRMSTSFLIAARDNGFTNAEAHAAALASITAYRSAMQEFAQLKTMDVWYASMDEAAITRAVTDFVTTQADTAKKAKPGDKKAAREAAKNAKRAARRMQRNSAKAHARDSLQALSKLGEMADGRYRIVSQPPIVIPVRDLAPQLSPDQLDHLVRDQFRAYRASLPPDMRHLLERFEVVDFAHKVVGVGSVGTRCFIVLLAGRDMSDPLFLQVKEANASVLEGHLPRSRYRQHGQRVVQGQRLMQAASDIYLGWTRGVDQSRHFYWRQLRDMKVSPAVEAMTPLGLAMYAKACGWTLARAHARSGDPVAIAAYLGESDAFDRSLLDFAARYADQNERDYAEFAAAVRSGQLPVTEGI